MGRVLSQRSTCSKANTHLELETVQSTGSRGKGHQIPRILHRITLMASPTRISAGHGRDESPLGRGLGRSFAKQQML